MGIQERKAREKEKRRKQILKAGERIFLKKGIENTTMEEIAAACELSKGTLYLYFRNKEDLFGTLMSDALDTFIAMIDKRLAIPQTPSDRLVSLGQIYLEFNRNHHEFFRLMNGITDQRTHKPDHSDITLENLKKINHILDSMTRVIHEAEQAGVIKPQKDPLMITLIFWAASNGVMALMDKISLHREPEIVRSSELTILNRLLEFNHEQGLNTLWDTIAHGIRIE